jgi:hypothetical protein
VPEPVRDGGIIDEAELILLGRRTAEELRELPVDALLAKQLRAVETVIDALVLRVAALTSDAIELSLDDQATALREARRLAATARAQLPEPDWDLFA